MDEGLSSVEAQIHHTVTQQVDIASWTSELLPQVKNLLTWVRDMRETGMAVSVNMTVIRASQIDSVFRCKSFSAKYSTIRHLLQSNGIVRRSKTHEAQTAPAEKREEAKAWVATDVPILTHNTAQSPSGLDSKHGSDPGSFYHDTQDYIE